MHRYPIYLGNLNIAFYNCKICRLPKGSIFVSYVINRQDCTEYRRLTRLMTAISPSGDRCARVCHIADSVPVCLSVCSQMMELLIQRRMRRPSENLDVSLEDLTRLLGEWPAGAAPGGGPPVAERRASACPPHLSAVPEDTDNESDLSDSMLTFRATPPEGRAGPDGTGPVPSSSAPGTPSTTAGTPPPAGEGPEVPGSPSAAQQAPETAVGSETAPGADSTADPAPSPPPAGDTTPPIVDSRRSSQCSHQETRC